MEFTKEQKQLILKDICQRYPYNLGVMCTHDDEPEVGYACMLTSDMLCEMFYGNSDRTFRPMLRRMETITELEFDELTELCTPIDKSSERQWNEFFMVNVAHYDDWGQTVYYSPKVHDWFNEHYIDYRGLIDENLAVEVVMGNKDYPVFYKIFE